MDFTNKDHIFTRIREVMSDNKALYAFCNELRIQIQAGRKEARESNKALESAQKQIKKLEEMVSAPQDMSDEVLMDELRGLLFSKLKDKSLSAAEIRELKELFGLTQKQADLVIETVDFKDAEW